MNINEIEAAFEDFEDDETGDGGWGFWNWELQDRDDEVVIEGLGRVEFVESEGGEGEGDHAHVVLRVGDRFFKKEGYYASYDGFTWDGDFKEVKPTQKTITVYE